MGNTFRLGTRGSALARWQADWVASQLRQHDVAVEIVLISTQGDQRSGPIGAIGSQGVFTKEIQRALLENEVDFAVHSLKDLPTESIDGLALASVPHRAPIGDALVLPDSTDHPETDDGPSEAENEASEQSSADRSLFEQLPSGARIGTGSARRRAQLLCQRPDLEVLEIRGNVDTRLAKLDSGEYDAIILAEAGLRRLGWEQRISQVLPPTWMLPAVGQGALGLECRDDDKATRDVLKLLDDATSHQSVVAERSLLAALRGGCMAPVGAWARPNESGEIQMDAAVLALDGSQRIAASGQASDQPHQLGERVAAQLQDGGAAELIVAARNDQAS